MKNFLFLAILAWVSVLFHGQQAYAATGVDFSALTSTSSLSCVKNYGYDHAVIRCYIEAWGQNPGGKVDSNCYQNYLNAKAAGFTSIDIYWFPCTGRSTCKSPATQLNEIVSYVGANKMIVGRLWLDVEIDPSANNWPSTTSARTTLQQFKTALDNSGWKWGVYSSKYQWETITGSTTWVLDSSVPLWYAGWDFALNFNNFSPFGGWSKPTVKQYAGDQSFCSAGFDKNYYG
ncbi:glycoside hydrolase superfamily [Phascolomyces articulosus]|uniref:Glycoside hydrolase superfamily n=1 Tax=Phascolomyces articulosus TaxID=60185 RepID=A0AAD5PEQ3_9FUNG|nr:glycoside hydrolase superfamily [Phascolomyces articulosus]